MDDNRTGSLPTHRAELRLVRAATDAVRNTCANPDRIDCPDSEAIQAIAARRLSYPTFDDVVDHIAMCAPCLEDYNRLRQQYRIRRRRRWVVGFAALLLLGLLWTYPPVREHYPGKQVAQKMQTSPLQAATLDYSGWTSERSVSPTSIKREAPRVPRARLALTILLPIGTEDGPYTVQVRSASGETVAQANGSANWTGTAEKLNVNLDVSRLPAGAYKLAVASGNGSHRSYPMLVE